MSKSVLDTLVRAMYGYPNIPQPSSQAISDCLLSELDVQIKETEERTKAEEAAARKRKMGGVDYSWLAAPPVKPFEIGHLERLELEDISYRIKPQECSEVISIFRNSIATRNPKLDDVAPTMRTAMLQVLEQRPKEETTSEWMRKSLTNLTKIKSKSSTKVAPLNSTKDESNTISKGNVFVTENSGNFVQSLDNLPV